MCFTKAKEKRLKERASHSPEITFFWLHVFIWETTKVMIEVRLHYV